MSLKASSSYQIYSGYIRLRNNHDANVITVPYAGVLGSWSEAPIWSRQSPEFDKRFLMPKLKALNNFQPDSSAATGVYSDEFTFVPLKEKVILNGTLGPYILPGMNMFFKSRCVVIIVCFV